MRSHLRLLIMLPQWVFFECRSIGMSCMSSSGAHYLFDSVCYHPPAASVAPREETNTCLGMFVWESGDVPPTLALSHDSRLPRNHQQACPAAIALYVESAGWVAATEGSTHN